MNPSALIIILVILCSFICSTLLALWLWQEGQRKWGAFLGSLCTNAIILILGAILLYKLDAQTFHKEIGGLGIILFPFFIPILTLITYYICLFTDRKSQS